MSILLCGANGRVCRHVIKALINNKFEIANLKLLVHREESIQELKSTFEPLKAATFVVGDYFNQQSLLSVLEGVSKVFYNASAFDPQETGMGIAVIDASRKAGIDHFIYCSVLHPLRTKLLNHKVKLAVEEYLIESHLNWTILQPTHYMQSVSLPNVSSSQKLPLAYSPDVLQGFLDIDDLAQVVITVLKDPSMHNLARYELLGETRTYRDVARVLSELFDKQIPCVQITPQEAAQNAVKSGLFKKTEYGEDGMARMLMYYDRWGLVGNPNVLTWLLGRKPNDWHAYATKALSK